MRPMSQMKTPLCAISVSVTLLLAGCGLFGADRPDPPPYPAETDASALRAGWINGSIGKAERGFAPALVGDAVWVASADGTVSRLSKASGRSEFSVRLPEKLGAGVGADASLVVVVSRDGDVIALDGDGKRRWTTPLKGEVVTAPSVASGVVLVRTVDGRIVALDRGGGTIRWTWQRQIPTLTLRQSSPLVVRDDSIYAGLPSARVVALDLRLGAPRWETVIATPRGATELERLVDIVGSPALASDQICAVAYQGKLACLRTEDGRVGWSRDIASAAGLSVRNDIVVTVDGSDVIQSVRPTGDAAWKQDGYVRRGVTTPIVADDRVLFGDRFGSLSLLSLADGVTLARLPLDGTPFASPPMIVDGIAYAQTVGGTVAAVAIR